MASHSATLLALAALSLVASAAAVCDVTQWPCSICASAQDQAKCSTCISNAATNGDYWRCQACNTLAAGSSASTDCYTCANSAVPGWYCQRLVQTATCLGATAPPNAITPVPGTGCLGCMAAAGNNNIDACINCANSFSTPADKQKCMNCVVGAKDAGGAAYSCTSAKLQACVAAYGPALASPCFNCLNQLGAGASDAAIQDCAFCQAAGRGSSCAIKDVTWAYNGVVGPVNPTVGDLIRFTWASRTHNVWETSTLVCPTDEDNVANGISLIRAEAVGPAKSGPVLLDKAGTRNFICSINAGNAAFAHCRDGNMKLAITVA